MRSLKILVPLLFGLACTTSSTSDGGDNTPADGGASSGNQSSSGSTSRQSSSGSTSRQSSSGTTSGLASSGATSVQNTSSASSGMGGSSSLPNTPPEVSSTLPANLAVNVWTGQRVTATFNKAMNAATLTPQSFTLLQGVTPVTGTVSFDAVTNTATFTPMSALMPSLQYTATITTAAQSAAGLALAQAMVWTFTTHAGLSTSPVNLGTAGNYAILAQTQISTVPASAITGNIAVSPAAATFITGFSLTLDGTGTFSTSPQITGRAYAADYTSPTPSNLTTAIGDMVIAFTDAAGRPPDVTELGAGNIGGMTLAPGVYRWGTGLLIPTDIQLNGGANDVWIFEIAQDLTVANGVNVSLAGGALPRNVFWQVAGLIQLGTTVHMEGILLSQTAITLGTGATVNGRLLAQSAVSLDSSTVTAPTP